METHSPSKDLLFHAIWPVQKHNSKKNQKTVRRRANGTSFIANRPENNFWAHTAILNLKAAQRDFDTIFPIPDKIHCKFLFHYKNTKNGKPWKKVIDLSNLYQGPEDVLQDAGIIVDDKLIESHDGSRRIYGADQFMVEIFIYKFIE